MYNNKVIYIVIFITLFTSIIIYLKNKLKKIQERNRGVSYTEYGKVEVNERKFAKYIVSRINLFRLDTNERYIENQETKGYETVSEVTIGKICMHIMDEYNDDYYFKYVNVF